MDKELLLSLYKRQAKIIYGYLIKIGCQKEEAEDIVQESFVKAIEYMDGVANDKLSSWLFKVALNNYKNRLKRKSIINQMSIDDGNFYYNLIFDNDVVDILIKKEHVDQIVTCLSYLKEEYRSLLILKYDLGLSYLEISKLLGIPENTVRTYLYRARNNFKEVWREKHGES